MAAQKSLKLQAERARSQVETHGKKAHLKPKSKPALGDLSAEVLAEPIWLKKVGTFGVASAGYWWGRAGAALFCLAH